MSYSFIKPRKKPTFTLFDKIFIGLFGFGVAFVLLICVVYKVKTALSISSTNDLKQELIKVQNQIKQNNELYEILIEQNKLARAFNTQNEAIKQSLKNLFDMVIKTDSITLQSVEQNENSLKLIGTTPTREMFAMLLETPLKSIFDQSSTSYYRLDNGWYRFVSLSKNLGALNER